MMIHIGEETWLHEEAIASKLIESDWLRTIVNQWLLIDIYHFFWDVVLAPKYISRISLIFS